MKTGAFLGLMLIAFMIGAGIAAVLSDYEYDKLEPEIIYQEKEQPMLMIKFNEWYGLEGDISKSVLSYFIYNFGNVESKNVTVRCEVSNLYTENIIKREIFSVGNIASNGYEFMESIMDYTIDYNVDNVGATCYIESANGEYINLYERLNDIE